MRATGGLLQSLRRRQAFTRRRCTFIARSGGDRIAAGMNERGDFFEGALRKAARLVPRLLAGDRIFPRSRRKIGAPLQRSEYKEHADGAFYEEKQNRLQDRQRLLERMSRPG